MNYRIKKILFGLAVGITCFSLTGCIKSEKQEKVQSTNVETIQKKINKTIDAVVYKQQKKEEEETSKVSNEKKTVTLNVKKDIYTSNSNKIIYTIKNTTGKTQQVVLAPRLERKTKDGYEDVPCITGFCGVADPVKKELEGSILLEWYPNLSRGIYRLSFKATVKTKKGTKEMTIKDTFSYKE